MTNAHILFVEKKNDYDTIKHIEEISILYMYILYRFDHVYQVMILFNSVFIITYLFIA